MDPARMPMTRRSPGQVRAALRLLRWLVVAGVTTGACVGLALGSRLGTGYVAIGVLKGIGLGGLFALTFGWLEQVALRRLWRRVSLGQAILLRTALYAPLALAVYAAVSIVFSPWIAWSLQRANLLPALAIAALSMLVWSAVVGIGHLIGFRVLGNLLSGRYHRPFQEDRIVLFLDLVGSTTMAERLGHLRYHAFLRDFIADLEEPLLDHGGDVYQYVGDEVVVTWPVADARSNGNCLACYFAIVDAIARSSARYAQLYGAAPSFRTGIHAGPVVAGEIGEWRKQIVFVGDVVNTASRAQALAKERGKDLVVTDAFLARVALPRGTAAISLGVVRPRGKEQSVEFFEIVRSSQP